MKPSFRWAYLRVISAVFSDWIKCKWVVQSVLTNSRARNSLGGLKWKVVGRGRFSSLTFTFNATPGRPPSCFFSRSIACIIWLTRCSISLFDWLGVKTQQGVGQKERGCHCTPFCNDGGASALIDGRNKGKARTIPQLTRSLLLVPRCFYDNLRFFLSVVRTHFRHFHTLSNLSLNPVG